MKKLVFRFDIDTHKCIRDGVPRLLAVANEYEVPFTFFLNCGKSISFINSLKSLVFGTNREDSEKPEMMSAMQKLGMKDYLVAAFINPNISNYKAQIKQLLDSGCEIGLHGGRNHAIWGNKTEWSEESVRQETVWALARVRKINPEFTPRGFASPEWNGPDFLPEILKEEGFTYYGDFRCVGQEPIKLDGILPIIGVNLLGEPGGVAFFENCRVRGLNDREIVRTIMDSFEKLDTVVLYDHPYYAGLNETGCIIKIIESAKSKGIQICKLEELI